MRRTLRSSRVHLLGCGLDDKQLYCNLGYIAVMTQEKTLDQNL
jgi:hypoxanthine-guanine phosphoribosyltransferase